MAIARRCYLVSYDIADPARLRRVFRTMKGYGEHWQLSVFFCVLRELDHARMKEHLRDIINQREDQVLVLDLGSDEDRARGTAEVLGQALPPPPSGFLVV